VTRKFGAASTLIAAPNFFHHTPLRGAARSIDALFQAGYNRAFSNRSVHSEVPTPTLSASVGRFRLAARFDEVGFSDIVLIRNRIMKLRAQGATVYQFEGG
jgi:hypothetical protein